LGSFQSVINEFQRNGILLESDPWFPSVAAIIAGGRVHGSWWSHPKNREIRRALDVLLSRRDVLVTRLVSGKVTFLHRPLWQDFLAIATSKETWQLDHLSSSAGRLFSHVERKGTVRIDKLPSVLSLGGRAGEAARELENRLLIHTDEVHTGRVVHTKALVSWKRWMARAHLAPGPRGVDEAKAKFVALVVSLNSSHGGDGRLPWIREDS
jgi:hypothetical protein